MGLKDKMKNVWKRVSDLEDETAGARGQATASDKIPYKEISRKLKEVMKQNVDVVGRKILIPNYYCVYFSEGDREARVEVENVLCEELKEELFPEMRKINPEQNKREMVIEIHTDSSLEKGQFRIAHHMKKPEAGEEAKAASATPQTSPPPPKPPVSDENDFKETIIEQRPQFTSDDQATIIQRPAEIRYKLLVDSADDQKEIEVTKDSLTIGRSSQDDVVLESSDFSISRAHAVLSTRDGNHYLLPSGINGTFLNGQELELKKEVQITPADEIKIMNYKLKIIAQE